MNTGTLRHSHKKNRPAPPPPTNAVNGKPPAAPDLEIRNPSELLVGVPATLTAQWRHRPEDLVSGKITYLANVSHFSLYRIVYKKEFPVPRVDGSERAKRHRIY